MRTRLRITGRDRISAPVASALTLLIGWSAPAHATDSNQTQYNKLCTTAGSPTGISSQQSDYCKSAKAAMDASSADHTLTMVWGGVAATCTAACLISYYPWGAASKWVCSGASLAGGVTDAMMTKQYAGIVGSLVGAAMPLMMAGKGAAAAGTAAAGTTGVTTGTTGTTTATSTATTTGGSTSNMDVGSCLSAAVGIGEAVMKSMDASSQDKTAKDNLASAGTLTSTTSTLAAADGVSAPTASGGGSGGSTTGSGGSGSDATPTASSSPTSTTCAQSGSGATAQAITQCAAATDSNLPGFVTSPEFAQELQGLSGQPADSLMNGSGGAGSTIGGMLAAALTPDQAAKLAAAIDGSDLSKAGGYSSGGGAAKSGDGEANPGDLLAAMMDKLGPKKDGAGKAPSGVDLVAMKANRSPAEVFEDRSLSLFDRITYRYRNVSPRLTASQASRRY